MNESWFVTLADARRISEAWRVDYNTERPHSVLEYLTPEAFEQRTLNAGCGSARLEAERAHPFAASVRQS